MEKRELTDTQLSSAITAKALVTFRLTVQPCGSVGKLLVAIATPADNLDTWLGTARIPIPQHSLWRLHQLEVAIAEGFGGEEAFKDVADSTLRLTEPQRATSAVGQIIMQEIARRKP